MAPSVSESGTGRTPIRRPGSAATPGGAFGGGWPWIAVVLLAGLGLRLLIVYVLAPGEGFRDDVLTFESWANTLAEHGPGAFYANTLPPGQSPGYLYGPGYLYPLWMVGLAGHAFAGLTGMAPHDAIALMIKLPAIASDLLIAVVLYRAISRWYRPAAGVVAAALYLFVPLTWYDSTLWGQVDAFGALLLLVSIVLLIDRRSELAVVFAVLAVETKPQYAIGLGVVAAVLVGRHWLKARSGSPARSEAPHAVGRRWIGWFEREHGLPRLMSSAIAGAAVFLVVLLPFDLWTLAPARLAGIPVVGPIAGLLIMDRSAAGYFPNLTVNAFNVWAFVGPTPLTQGLANQDTLTPDSIRLVGSLTAQVVGTVLFGLVAMIVLAALLIRDDRDAILMGFTVLALAFFILPTRAHERYLFPAVAAGAALAAGSVRWRWWVVALGVIHAANLHAVASMARYGTPGLQGAPFGSELRTEVSVATLSIGHVLLFAGALCAFLRQVWRPALADVLGAIAAIRGSRSGTASD
jgi:dolichyl-phosphate-mannose-protein mannosyltransferase